MKDDTLELRFRVSKDYVTRLQKALNKSSASEVAQEALSMLNWAVGERERDRVILSSDSGGEHVERLVTPGLSQVEPKSQR